MATKLKQYADTIRVTADELDEVTATSEDILEYGIEQMDSNLLTSSLSISASVATMVWAFTKKKNFALGLVGLVLGFQPSLRDQLADHVRKANRELHSIRRFMKRNPDYIQVEIEAPFMDFDGGRVITGEGVVHRVKTRSGWITL
ncbi:hypothetical protein [Brevibacillus reuszeri]|uniref:hypothetical protein n=1 Tax=Brevibacillus reuszeri TaxID=54915 RepID=UPI000CCC0BB2|nr:hypothetical protein [Brevibacillus reuszeri]